MSSLRAVARLVVLAAFEVGVLVVLHRLGARPELRVEPDLVTWLAVTGAEQAVVAALRYVALGAAWWLAVTTGLYVVARATRVPAAVRAVGWATLPAARRLADRAVAASLATTLVTGAPAAAVAAPAPLAAAATETTIDAPPSPLDRAVDARARPEPSSVVAPPDLPLPGSVPPTVSSPTAGLPRSSNPARPPRSALAPPPGRLPPLGAPTPATPGEHVVAGDAAPPPLGSPDADLAPDVVPPAVAPPAAVVPPDPVASGDAAAATARHVVVAGENLWTIAERHLAAATGRAVSDAEVAVYWRAVVVATLPSLRSGDADLIHPGETVLLPPLNGDSHGTGTPS